MDVEVKARYEGRLEIHRNVNLTLVEQIIEHHFANEIQGNLNVFMRRYKAEHGKILDTDRARDFSSVWNLSNISRALLSAAVHNPASAFVNRLYRTMLRQRRHGSVIFTAGGGGSGKSAAMEPFAKQMLDEALLIYDTTLSNQTTAVGKIEAALQHNRSVFILFVYRPFAAAVQGVLHRALLSGGRIVPLHILTDDHINAPRTVLHIATTYAANDNVQVILLDNSGREVADVKVISEPVEVLYFLRNIAYNDREGLLRQAKGVLENEKSKGYLPDYIVEALERNDERGKSA